MMAGLVNTLWTIEDLYDAISKQQAQQKQRELIAKLLKELPSF